MMCVAAGAGRPNSNSPPRDSSTRLIPPCLRPGGAPVCVSVLRSSWTPLLPLLALAFLGLADVAAAAEPSVPIRADFPGGNVLVKKLDGDAVHLARACSALR